jgi:hypothetical protein
MSPLARARPSWNHAPIAARRLNVLASQLENRTGAQQHHNQSANEK